MTPPRACRTGGCCSNSWSMPIASAVRTADRMRWCTWISTTSRWSTTRSDTGWATHCWWRLRIASARCWARAEQWPDWVPTSSPYCCRTPTWRGAGSCQRSGGFLGEPVVIEGVEILVRASAGVAAAEVSDHGGGRARRSPTANSCSMQPTSRSTTHGRRAGAGRTLRGELRGTGGASPARRQCRHRGGRAEHAFGSTTSPSSTSRNITCWRWRPSCAGTAARS